MKKTDQELVLDQRKNRTDGDTVRRSGDSSVNDCFSG